MQKLFKFPRLLGWAALLAFASQLLSARPVQAQQNNVSFYTLFSTRCETFAYRDTNGSGDGTTTLGIEFYTVNTDATQILLLNNATWTPALYFAGASAVGVDGLTFSPRNIQSLAGVPKFKLTDNLTYPATVDLYASHYAVGGVQANGTKYDLTAGGTPTAFNNPSFNIGTGRLVYPNFSYTVPCDLNITDDLAFEPPQPEDNDQDGDYYAGLECYGENSFPFDSDPANGCHFRPPA